MPMTETHDGADLLDELEDVAHGTLELLFVDGMCSDGKMANNWEKVSMASD